MTKRQKTKITNALLTGLKIVASIFVFVGLTLTTSNNFHIELYCYLSLMIGTILFMIYFWRANDHLLLLLTVTGFAVVGDAFLHTETAILIANNYGIALTEEQGWFAKYGNVLVSIIKELV